MNSKGIKAVTDTKICMKCLQKKATHQYEVYGRGEESSFYEEDIRFQCCDNCNIPEYEVWFNEQPTLTHGAARYKYEKKIHSLIESLPLEGRELVENRFNSVGLNMEPQHWIDYQLDELPHTICKKYYLISAEEKEAYAMRFPTCEHVVEVRYSDGTVRSMCPFNATGACNQQPDGVSTLCRQCKYYQRRITKLKAIKRADLADWLLYSQAKIRKKELKEKFEA